MEGFWTVLANIEGPVLLWFQEVARRPGVNEAVSFFTHLGDGGMLWILLCALLLLFPRTRRAGLAGAAALVWGREWARQPRSFFSRRISSPKNRSI